MWFVANLAEYNEQLYECQGTSDAEKSNRLKESLDVWEKVITVFLKRGVPVILILTMKDLLTKKICEYKLDPKRWHSEYNGGLNVENVINWIIGLYLSRLTKVVGDKKKTKIFIVNPIDRKTIEPLVKQALQLDHYKKLDNAGEMMYKLKFIM